MTESKTAAEIQAMFNKAVAAGRVSLNLMDFPCHRNSIRSQPGSSPTGPCQPA